MSEQKGKWETWVDGTTRFIYRDPDGRFSRIPELPPTIKKEELYEYTKWFYYPKSAENRELDLEVRLRSPKRLSMEKAEQIMDSELRNEYNMEEVTFHQAKMGREKIVAAVKRVREVIVYDKKRQRVMRPWKEYMRR